MITESDSPTTPGSLIYGVQGRSSSAHCSIVQLLEGNRLYIPTRSAKRGPRLKGHQTASQHALIRRHSAATELSGQMRIEANWNKSKLKPFEQIENRRIIMRLTRAKMLLCVQDAMTNISNCRAVTCDWLDLTRPGLVTNSPKNSSAFTTRSAQVQTESNNCLTNLSM